MNRVFLSLRQSVKKNPQGRVSDADRSYDTMAELVALMIGEKISTQLPLPKWSTSFSCAIAS
jgi:hypothetical protein